MGRAKGRRDDRTVALIPEVEGRLRAGETGIAVAQALGLNRKTVYSIAQEAGIQMPVPGRYKRKLDYEEIRRLAGEGLSVPEIARSLGGRKGGVQAACYRMRIRPRDGRHMKGVCIISWCRADATSDASLRWPMLCKEHRRQRRIWWSMRARTGNPRCSEYMNYGGRGIELCSRWRDDPILFMEDMGQLPGPGRWEIDRKDVNGNYEPGNCRWVTRAENAKNKRSVREMQAEIDRLRAALAALKVN